MKKLLSLLSLAALTIGLLGSCKKEDLKVSVSSVTLDKPSLEITVGTPDVKLTATVAPDNATDKTLNWSSDNTDVATVDNEGNVHAIAEGTATITVTTTDGGKTATCTVTVVMPVKVTKIADYLYEYTAEGYSTEAPSELLFDDGPVPIFGCSAVRNGNFYGRNLDFNINEICEFVVRTKATETRPHASIGVANTCFLNITNDMVKAGLSEKLLKYIPWMTLDGINDAGLVCNINVVNAADTKKNPHKPTNEGAPQIMVMQLVRALLDNCGSVAQAKTYIESHDIREIPTTWDGHIMVADPKETMIVEFTGEKGNEVKFVVQEQMIMTNFYNHLFKEENFLRDRSINNFPKHSCGMERYFILSDNYATGNSMQGMWDLLKSVRYTQSYDTSVDPFWCSEYYDTPKIPTFDDHPMSYWTKEKVLAEEKPKKEVEAYKKYAATGEYNEEDGLWFTSHNSTYDIANKALWVTVREKYKDVYKFELK